MPWITTNDGVRLHYYDEGEGRPVLLVSGYGAPADDWALQWAPLRAAGYRVISLDRRWHGRSDRPAWGQRMSRHGKDIDELLTALGLRDVLAVGQSMGANSIWAYVSLAGTARLAGIVTVDQTPSMVNTADWPFGFYGLTEENLGTFFSSPGAFATGRGRAWPDPAAVDTAIREAGGRGAESLITPDTRPLLLDHSRQDWRDVVARAEVPVLITAGADSQFWPAEHAAATAALNPRATSAVFADAGHSCHLDRPEAVADRIVEFAGTLGGPSRRTGPR
ncbi:alpha/beta fold hydrolase [Streptomyces sp. NPDC090077]|uniref:alpha/beta fold hydrolase n=1 Tax=Streptomyces sp. NPDC090077 TaxID=3365938 RepID=UPI0038048A94